MSRVLCVVLGLVLAMGAAASPAPGAQRKGGGADKLTAFRSCDSLVSYARRNARRTGGGPGVPTRAPSLTPLVITPINDVMSESLAAPAPAAGQDESSGGSGATGGPGFSGTNVQEAGVDEPDVVKTDGKRVVAITADTLRILDVTGPGPRVVGTLKLEGYAQQMLIRGDRALVMASLGEETLLSEVDLANPAAPAVRRTMTLAGAPIAARLTGGTARVVVASSPGYLRPQALPRTSARTWVPRTVLRSRISGRTFRRSVVPCDDVRRPPEFSGLDLLTVLTVDLDKGLFSVDRDAIMAGAQTVYASQTGLYVASQRYVRALERERELPPRMDTEIHRFDTSKTGETAYASTGEVPGYVLNQYSMSEHEGALRVASTETPAWLGGDVAVPAQAREEQSFVTVLRERGARLARAGQVGGLGKGERIYAVRFMGDKGYVVTFRQVDPLYTLDLADPADPKVLGELKILGYSAYLHPVSGDRLLGIGQDASEDGRTRGSQLSLFDVSDLRNPRRVAQAALGTDSSSPAEFDPHAFLYWDPTRLAVIPLERYGQSSREAAALGFRVGASSLEEAGRVVHRQGEDTVPIGRSLVIGDRLYTLSSAGLGVSRLDSMEPLGFSAF